MDTESQYIPVDEVDRRIAEIERLLRELPVELAALKRIRAGAVLFGTASSRTEFSERGIAVVNGGKLGPTDAVISYLSRNPRTTAKDLVGLLADSIDTKAKDKKRCLKSTIYNLIYKERLEQDENGQLTVLSNGQA